MAAWPVIAGWHRYVAWQTSICLRFFGHKCTWPTQFWAFFDLTFHYHLETYFNIFILPLPTSDRRLRVQVFFLRQYSDGATVMYYFYRFRDESSQNRYNVGLMSVTMDLVIFNDFEWPWKLGRTRRVHFSGGPTVVAPKFLERPQHAENSFCKVTKLGDGVTSCSVHYDPHHTSGLTGSEIYWPRALRIVRKPD